MLLERLVIRCLYGRPLETLLRPGASPGARSSACASIFGAQNVQVENPSWMSGGVRADAGHGAALQPDRDRRFRRRRAGRRLAAADAHAPGPVRAPRDAEPRDGRARWACRRRASTAGPSAWARAIAGLAGCALSQIGNVGAGPRSGLHRRLVHGGRCWAASASSPARSARAGARASSTSCSKPGRARCSRRSPCWRSSSCSSRSAAGPVRAQGPRGGGLTRWPCFAPLALERKSPALAGGWLAACAPPSPPHCLVVFPVGTCSFPEGSALHLSEYCGERSAARSSATRSSRWRWT